MYIIQCFTINPAPELVSVGSGLLPDLVGRVGYSLDEVKSSQLPELVGSMDNSSPKRLGRFHLVPTSTPKAARLLQDSFRPHFVICRHPPVSITLFLNGLGTYPERPCLLLLSTSCMSGLPTHLCPCHLAQAAHLLIWPVWCVVEGRNPIAMASSTVRALARASYFVHPQEVVWPTRGNN